MSLYLFKQDPPSNGPSYFEPSQLLPRHDSLCFRKPFLPTPVKLDHCLYSFCEQPPPLVAISLLHVRSIVPVTGEALL